MFSLRYLLAKLSHRANPDADFVRALNQRILGTSHVWQPWAHQLMPRLAAVMLVLVPVGGVGTSVYAYNSPSVLPQHPLYGVRLAVESLERAVTPKEKLPDVQQKQLARRAEEARLAQVKGVPMDDQFAKRLIEQADQVSEAASSSQNVESENAEVGAANLQEMVSQQDLVAPEEKPALDKMGYQQAEDVAKDLSNRDDDDVMKAEKIDLQQIEER